MEGAEFVRDGFVRGRLYRVDWYPAIVLDDKAGWVKGELWKATSEHLAALDEFEGGEYERVEASVRQVSLDTYFHEWQDNDRIAWIWAWREGVDQLALIESGDWMDVECPRQKSLYTFMGCLSLIALPVGGSVIGTYVWELVGGSELFSSIFGGVIVLGTPLLAIFLVRCAERRRELGQGWQDMANGVASIWLGGLGIVMLLKIAEFLMRIF